MKNNLLNNKKFMIIVVILTILLCVLMIIQNYLKIKERKIQETIATGKFDSIKAILEYYDCKYIKEKKSSDENFSIEIYTEFKYDLYDDEESNEDFYNTLINEIAKFLKYESFKIIDESKEEKIEIDVICDGQEIETIIINGIEDYFMYMDSQIDAKKFKKIKETDFLIQSPELLKCIENNWNKSVDFGTRESIFQNYDVYFDEGIRVRTISNRVYNVIFSTKYAKNVINGLNSSSKYDIIVRELGEPTFKNSDKSIIGYKSKDMYIFFEDSEISVYRNTQENYDDFFELVDRYLAKQYTFIEFMNQLTYIWSDYEYYDYSEDSIFLTYPTKGIEIKVNYDNTNGIVIYNNIGVDRNGVKKYLQSTDFISKMKIDSIYKAEERRVNNKNRFKDLCDEYKNKYEKEDDRNHGKIFDYYMNIGSNEKIQSVFFISNDDRYCDNQLIEGIDDYIWINETTFVYSKQERGIYSFNLETGQKSVIITGNDIYKINNFENGILSYDETSINL